MIFLTQHTAAETAPEQPVCCAAELLKQATETLRRYELSRRVNPSGFPERARSRQPGAASATPSPSKPSPSKSKLQVSSNHDYGSWSFVAGNAAVRAGLQCTPTHPSPSCRRPPTPTRQHAHNSPGLRFLTVLPIPYVAPVIQAPPQGAMPAPCVAAPNLYAASISAPTFADSPADAPWMPVATALLQTRPTATDAQATSNYTCAVEHAPHHSGGPSSSTQFVPPSLTQGQGQGTPTPTTTILASDCGRPRASRARFSIPQEVLPVYSSGTVSTRTLVAPPMDTSQPLSAQAQVWASSPLSSLVAAASAAARVPLFVHVSLHVDDHSKTQALQQRRLAPLLPIS
jgi:hypothetical protein